MATPTLVRGARATQSTITLKIAMAVSGILFILFVLAHMYGNLKVFSGEEAFNSYAEHLRTIGAPIFPRTGVLWILRVGLIASLIVHVACAVTLARRAGRARPVQYQVKRNVNSAFSSRTMRWGGATILMFLIWHLLNFTIVKINPTGGETENPYRLLVDNFGVWWMTIIYLVAMAALALHLHHGTWSSLQTLGLTNSPLARQRAKLAGWVVAVVVAGGFSLVPLSVLVGITK
ncbi:succinate dehydrogenase cytochrome b subunit [Nocardioides sp. TRM66260-LWL]|uniref:succinate dehydrogenase cytochrome b subunit n=1 Tax=Nocardioides sp. TRM66260-LWL TaxID=2874478 RepID=UPI001CC6863E|nr:succinate dehydrogenase cytochrome b subunit [Nocardioides sp. TRM66260-LWL]MBZ5733247.1 succinate dehydrogenase cytochrome b subunit [Nocardioides sp. TRM66260-LWL]